jgi:hypothetical protein
VHSLDPIWYNEGKGKKGPFIFIFSRKGVNDNIFFAFLVNYLIIITKEISYPFLFFRGGRLLLQKILEDLMTCTNLEAFPQEIRALEIYCI